MQVAKTAQFITILKDDMPHHRDCYIPFFSAFRARAIRPHVARAMRPFRRGWIGGWWLAAMLAWSCAAPGRAGEPPPRIVVLEWTAASMLLSLGVAPAGMADIDLYRAWVA